MAQRLLLEYNTECCTHKPDIVSPYLSALSPKFKQNTQNFSLIPNIPNQPYQKQSAIHNAPKYHHAPRLRGCNARYRHAHRLLSSTNDYLHSQCCPFLLRCACPRHKRRHMQLDRYHDVCSWRQCIYKRRLYHYHGRWTDTRPVSCTLRK